jgi:hypothetical protein
VPNWRSVTSLMFCAQTIGAGRRAAAAAAAPVFSRLRREAVAFGVFRHACRLLAVGLGLGGQAARAGAGRPRSARSRRPGFLRIGEERPRRAHRRDLLSPAACTVSATCVPWYSMPVTVPSMPPAPCGLRDRRSAREMPVGQAITLCPPMKRATNSVLRRVEDLARRAGLFDHRVVHHDDLVGQRQRLVLAVGDVDEGDAQLALQLQLGRASGCAGTGRAPTAARRAAAPAAR